MRQIVLAALAGSPRDLVIDLRAVHSMPDAAVSLLVGVKARQRARRHSLTLVCSKGSVTEQALRRTGLTRAFTVVSAQSLLPPVVT
jgi:anti-anti-sigma factor